MASKLVKALYVGSAPARLDPQGIDLIPGETVVEIDEATAKANAIWKPKGKVTAPKRRRKKGAKKAQPVPAPMNAETPAVPDIPPVETPPAPKTDTGGES